MDEKLLKEIIQETITKVLNQTQNDEILMEQSARHVHLSLEAFNVLFPNQSSLTIKKELSQPSQYLCEERVNVVTSKGELKNVAVLGPLRKETQVEISLTDSRVLGIQAPVNLSGYLNNAQTVFLISEYGCFEAKQSAIVARNHIHMNNSEAKKFNVVDKQLVDVDVESNRKVTFRDVIVRVDDSFKLAFHIDFDEANSCQYNNQTKAYLRRK